MHWLMRRITPIALFGMFLLSTSGVAHAQDALFQQSDLQVLMAMYSAQTV